MPKVTIPSPSATIGARFAAAALAAVAALFAVAPAPAQDFGGVRYLGQFMPSGGSYIAGCWGWTDSTGREYALLGQYAGTAIVEITNTASMVERDFIPGPVSSWREIQVHGNYAYVVSEGGGGAQIINLSYLPDSAHWVKNFVFTSGGKNTDRTHSNHIKDGYLYMNGCANWSPGGSVIFNLANPENPSFAGEYAGTYMHDVYVRNDTLFGAGIYGSGLHIVDVSSKASPVLLDMITYPGAGTHNASVTQDGRYALTTDEIGSTAKTLKIWDLRTSGLPKVAEYAGSPTAIVHNVFIRGDLAIMSYYTAGMRVLDVSDAEDPVEIGGYDTYNPGDPGAYDGAWSVYPFFPSGKIVIGDMSSGMYVVDVNPDAPKYVPSFNAASTYSTPTTVQLTWTDPTELINGDPLSDFVLHIYRNGAYVAEVDSGVGTWTDVGRTQHVLYHYSIRAVIASDSSVISTDSAWAGGHPNPAMPQGFQAHDGTDGVSLEWINPSTQADGTPLNDLAWIVILRNGAPFDSIAQTPADTGQLRAYVDSVQGYYSYAVRARDNETPVHYSATTGSQSGFGGLYLSYFETFDSTLSTLQTAGGWDTTSSIAAGGTLSLTDSPFGSYDPSTTSTVVFPPVALGNDPILQFDHIAIVAVGDFAFVDISRDNRQTYSVLKVYNWSMHPGWNDGAAGPGDWDQEFFDLSDYAGDTVNIRFRLVTNPTVNAAGWYVDNVYVGPTGQPAARVYDVGAGWNLLSLPLDPAQPSHDSVYPTSATEAFAYEGGYVDADPLEVGEGFWLKFDAPSAVPIAGTTVLRETLHVLSGWNLVGGISETLAVAGLPSIPSGIIESPFYGYENGYQTSPQVVPGKGYWVKTTQNGKIILSTLIGKAAPGTAGDSPEAAAPEGRLTIVDAAGRRMTLDVTSGGAAAAGPASSRELPPLPPPGGFDVRFTSGTDLALLTSPEDRAAIGLQGVVYPLEVGWRSANGSTIELHLDRTAPGGGSGDEAGGAAGSGAGVRPLADGDVVRVRGASELSLTGFRPGAGNVPEGYSLSQNYPNPFNPSTSFDLSLPEAGHVSLVIYSTLGEEVARPLAAGPEYYEAGRHTIVWDLSGDERIPAGVYYAAISVSDNSGQTRFTGRRKVLYIK